MKNLNENETLVIRDNIVKHIDNMIMRRKMTCPNCLQLDTDIREAEQIKKQIEYFSDMKEK